MLMADSHASPGSNQASEAPSINPDIVIYGIEGCNDIDDAAGHSDVVVEGDLEEDDNDDLPPTSESEGEDENKGISLYCFDHLYFY